MAGPSPDTPRLLVGRYVIERQIGRGSTATVFLALDNTSGQQVALKILREELVQSAAHHRFEREIRLSSQLSHPHLLPVLDAGQDGSRVYFALPYMDGGSLRERLNRDKQLPLDEAVRIAAVVAESLAYAHSLNLIHRDVKPENILFAEGAPHLADFGIARALANALGLPDDSTSTGVVRGTLAYMSPEQASGSTDYDGRSDVFALGCVLYEMLAGVPAFHGATPEAALAQRFTHRPRDINAFRATVSNELSAAVMKALAFTPADRFESAAAMAQALRTIDSAGQLTRSQTREFRVVHASRQRVRIGIGVTVALAGATMLAVAKYAASAPSPPRIAVMYFESRSTDSALGRFADGLTEELIYELGGQNANAFRVVPRSDVRQYRGRPVAAVALGTSLDAATIVEGTVARDNAGLRILVQIVDAKSGTYADSFSMSEPMAPPLASEREIAQRVGAAIRVRLGRESQLRRILSGTSSAEGKALALKALAARNDAVSLASRPSLEDLASARSSFRRADSLMILAGASDTTWSTPLINRGRWGLEHAELLADRTRDTMLLRSVSLAEEVLRRLPGSAEALELRGAARFALLFSTADTTLLSKAEADVRAALDRDSTLAGAWASLSEILWSGAKHAEALQAAQRALREDAYLTRVRSVYQNLYYNALMLGDFAHAGEWCQRGRTSLSDDPSFVECQLTLMRHDAAAAPDSGRAWALVRELEAMDPAQKATALGRTYATTYRRMVAAAISLRAGDAARARAELARARREFQGDSGRLVLLAYDEAYLRWKLGEVPQARKLIETFICKQASSHSFLARDPLFLGFRIPNPTC